MSFKKFCDDNGYKPESRKKPEKLEFRAAKKAWFVQQQKIESMQNKIDAFNLSY